MPLFVESITGKDGTGGGSPITFSGDSVTLGSGTSLGSDIAFPAGHIIQTVSMTKTDTFFSSTSQSWVDITGFSLNITPTSSDNKVLIMAHVVCGGNGHFTIRMMRVLDSVESFPYAGDAEGSSRPRCNIKHISSYTHQQWSDFVSFLDSPNTTNQITYKFQAGALYSSSYGVTLNRSWASSDATWDGRTASSITAFEVKV